MNLQNSNKCICGKDFSKLNEYNIKQHKEHCSAIKSAKNHKPLNNIFSKLTQSFSSKTTTPQKTQAVNKIVDEIIIEDDVLLGSGVHLYTSNHLFSSDLIPISYQGYPPATLADSILIKRGAWIGANTIIMPGVIIGNNAVIGAGTIVTKSVPPCSVFAGNPGKIIKMIC